MARSTQVRIQSNFVKGFTTESNSISHPQDILIDVENMDINKDGSLETRNGLQETELFSDIPTDENTTNASAILGLEVSDLINVDVWPGNAHTTQRDIHITLGNKIEPVIFHCKDFNGVLQRVETTDYLSAEELPNGEFRIGSGSATAGTLGTWKRWR